MEKYLTHKDKYDKILSQYRRKGYRNLTKCDLKLIVPHLMKTGQDNDLQLCLNIGLDSHPEELFFYIQRVEYLMFLGDNSSAHDLIKKAQFLYPGNALCAALSVALTYQVANNINEAYKFT
ncbi:MAG: hypothetical protein PF637_11745 [Spirochaetes bacterium]|jgi:hypothetical protein|nr:hypothetical protein [Spirochaetota bacterium]